MFGKCVDEAVSINLFCKKEFKQSPGNEVINRADRVLKLCEFAYDYVTADLQWLMNMQFGLRMQEVDYALLFGEPPPLELVHSWYYPGSHYKACDHLECRLEIRGPRRPQNMTGMATILSHKKSPRPFG